ncbi:uncharacterized protein LOC128961003 [Oppia nitens]|uniref:uncharacterized protein LOC128961003 n=1 Tax=Oppia nitens TaxID=1686743 RepID=UPI0023DC1057|nr:uncharacterized protein LOC128961003 [Oppia nitens]
MAFWDTEPTDACAAKATALKNTVTSSNAFNGIVVPTSGWQLEIMKMPINTTVDDLTTMFTKYGQLDKAALIYKLKDNTVNCYVSFDNPIDSETALQEDGRKVNTELISVIKFVDSNGDKGNKRLRTDDNSTSNGWGSTTTSSSDGWGADSFGGGDSSSRGRGRGRGGGGGGGGRACFNCGDDGHMSRECPKPKKNGGGGGRSCFKCGEEGHMSRECPKGGGNKCFNCQGEGHISRDCTQPRSSRGRGRGGRGGGGGGGHGGDSYGASSGGGDSWGTSGGDSWGTSASSGATGPSPAAPAAASNGGDDGWD